jgi:hypothetical protein
MPDNTTATAALTPASTPLDEKRREDDDELQILARARAQIIAEQAQAQANNQARLNAVQLYQNLMKKQDKFRELNTELKKAGFADVAKPDSSNVLEIDNGQLKLEFHGSAQGSWCLLLRDKQTKDVYVLATAPGYEYSITSKVSLGNDKKSHTSLLIDGDQVKAYLSDSEANNACVKVGILTAHEKHSGDISRFLRGKLGSSQNVVYPNVNSYNNTLGNAASKEQVTDFAMTPQQPQAAASASPSSSSSVAPAPVVPVAPSSSNATQALAPTLATAAAPSAVSAPAAASSAPSSAASAAPASQPAQQAQISKEQASELLKSHTKYKAFFSGIFTLISGGVSILAGLIGAANPVVFIAAVMSVVGLLSTAKYGEEYRNWNGSDQSVQETNEAKENAPSKNLIIGLVVVACLVLLFGTLPLIPGLGFIGVDIAVGMIIGGVACVGAILKLVADKNLADGVIKAEQEVAARQQQQQQVAVQQPQQQQQQLSQKQLHGSSAATASPPNPHFNEAANFVELIGVKNENNVVEKVKAAIMHYTSSSHSSSVAGQFEDKVYKQHIENWYKTLTDSDKRQIVQFIIQGYKNEDNEFKTKILPDSIKQDMSNQELEIPVASTVQSTTSPVPPPATHVVSSSDTGGVNQGPAIN